jgi:DNA-binding transcriptional ArsR family regulator
MDDAFKALADPTRRAVIDLLAERPRTVGELLEHFACSQPALSKHLRIMREAGLVAAVRDGRWRRYQLADTALGDVATWLARHRRFWGARLGALGKLLDDEARREGD